MTPQEQGRRHEHPAGRDDHRHDAPHQPPPPAEYQDAEADDVAELWQDMGEAGA